jgi:hypothetical protein
MIHSWGTFKVIVLLAQSGQYCTLSMKTGSWRYRPLVVPWPWFCVMLNATGGWASVPGYLSGSPAEEATGRSSEMPSALVPGWIDTR